jgi:hypothetical protein
MNPLIEPLIIFPEGGTSNGKYLTEFKKGAFVGLRSLWPKVLKTTSAFQSPCTGVVDGLAHYLCAAAIIYTHIEIIELPIFRPNEYFFVNHQKEGEERW